MKNRFSSDAPPPRRTSVAHAAFAVLVLIVCAGTASASLRSQVLYARGLIPYNEGRWEQAYALFNDAVNADAGDALALYYRGLAQAKRGSNEAAIEDIRQALRIEPRLPNAALDLGVALFDHGQFADAQRALRVAAGRGESPARAAFFLGLCSYRLGDYAEAEQQFATAAEDPGVRQAALYYSALASLRAGDSATARDRMRQAAEAEPASEIGRLAGRYAMMPADSVAAPAPRAEKPWSLRAETRLEYDSNVVAGASDGVDGTDAAGDGRPVLRVGGSYRLLETTPGELTVSADYGQSVHFSEREFDLSTVRLRLDWNGTPYRGWSWGAGAGYEFDALDYSGFSQAFDVQPWLAYFENDVTATQAYWRFRYRDFLDSPFDPFRDGFNNAVGLRQYWLPLTGLTAHAGYQFDAETPEDTGASDPFVAAGAEDFEYFGHQLDVGAAYAFDLFGLGASALRGGYRFRLDDYSNPNSRSRGVGVTGDGKAREDLEHTLALELRNDLAGPRQWLGDTVRTLDLTVGLITLFNDSNLSEFEYTRVVGAIGIQAQF